MDTHPHFIENNRKANKWERLAGHWIALAGHDVFYPEKTEAPTREEAMDHVDGGDLWVNQISRTEVKHAEKPQYEFTCFKDYPFPRRYLICAKHVFDNADPKPLVVIYISYSGKYAGLAFGADCRYWWWEWVRDVRYDILNPDGSVKTPHYEKHYCCHPSIVDFVPLNEPCPIRFPRVKGA